MSAVTEPFPPILGEKAERVTRELLDIARTLRGAINDFGPLVSAVDVLADGDEAWSALYAGTGAEDAHAVLVHIGALVEEHLGATNFRQLESDELSALLRKYQATAPDEDPALAPVRKAFDYVRLAAEQLLLASLRLEVPE